MKHHESVIIPFLPISGIIIRCEEKRPFRHDTTAINPCDLCLLWHYVTGQLDCLCLSALNSYLCPDLLPNLIKTRYYSIIMHYDQIRYLSYIQNDQTSSLVKMP